MATTKKHKLRFELPEEAPAPVKTAKASAPSGWVYRSDAPTSDLLKSRGQEGLLDLGARTVAYQAAAVTHAFLFGARLIGLPLSVAKRIAR